LKVHMHGDDSWIPYLTKAGLLTLKSLSLCIGFERQNMKVAS